MHELLLQHLGPNWLQPAEDPVWNRVDQIPDDVYWAARMHQKEALLEALRSSIPHFAELFHLTTAQRKSMEHLLTPETLVIGFARRFAPYKRATLIFADLERLLRIMARPTAPSFWSFPARPTLRTRPASTSFRRCCTSPRRTLPGPRLFMENYSLAVSRLLSQGCDVWLQYSPTPPRGFGHQRHETARQRRREPEHIRRLVVRRLQPPERLDHRPRSHHRTAQQRTKRLRRRRSPLHPAGKRRPAPLLRA